MLSLQDFTNGNTRLPSPPAVAVKILDAIRRDEDSFSELADIIKTDPALTARILKVANSSLYRLPNHVDSLVQATGLIGMRALRNIALSFVIIEELKDVHQGSFDIDLFWRRSVSSAVAAETLAYELSLTNHDIFIAALLQDLGLLIMFLADAAQYTEIIDNKRVSGKSTAEAEKESLGYDHTEVGYHLLKTWNLPDTICEPIRLHHSSESDTQWAQSAHILALADKISSIYHGTQRNKKSIEVNQTLKEAHGMQQDRIDGIIDQIGSQSLEIMECFSIPPGKLKPFSQIIQDANEELLRQNYSYEQIVIELTQAKQNAEQLAIELKRANAKLRELALRDGLTGLYNHRYFYEVFETQLQSSLRYNHPITLLLLDIDHFKQINDTYGHPAGDYVLKELSQVMISLVRRSDIIARYGGEEFAIILPETGSVSGRVIAQRLRRGIEQHTITYDNQSISVTISIGLASSDSEKSDYTREVLISRGDQALYKAKENGRNRIES